MLVEARNAKLNIIKDIEELRGGFSYLHGEEAIGGVDSVRLLVEYLTGIPAIRLTQAIRLTERCTGMVVSVCVTRVVYYSGIYKAIELVNVTFQVRLHPYSDSGYCLPACR